MEARTSEYSKEILNHFNFYIIIINFFPYQINK